jgi:hypothetical protein
MANGTLLYIQQCHQMQGISRPPEELLVSQEGVCFVLLIIYFVKYFDIPKYEH